MKLIILVIGIVATSKQVFSQNHGSLNAVTDYINDITTPAPGKQITCKPGYDCVPYNLCRNNIIVKDGTGLIDLRTGFCDDSVSTCCAVTNVTSASATPTPPPIPTQCGFRNTNGVSVRIIGNDNEAQFAEFPWQIIIYSRSKNELTGQAFNKYECGGSLISELVVLTAAHCVAGIQSHLLTVRAGEWDIKTTGEPFPIQQREVAQVVLHPSFNSKNLHNDFALLFLLAPLKLAVNVQPICLSPTNSEFSYQTCYTAGWGKKRFMEGSFSVILKKIDVPIMPHDQCQKLLRNTRLGDYFTLDSSFVCAGGEENKDSCIGDGGSPLVCAIVGGGKQYYQVGIVSWGIGCGERDIPGVYAKISHVRTWIDEQMFEKGLDKASYEPVIIPRDVV